MMFERGTQAAVRGSSRRAQPCGISSDTANCSGETCSQGQGSSKSSGGNGFVPLVPEVLPWGGKGIFLPEANK